MSLFLLVRFHYQYLNFINVLVEDVIDELERLQINGIEAVEQGMLNAEEDDYYTDEEDC